MQKSDKTTTEQTDVCQTRKEEEVGQEHETTISFFFLFLQKIKCLESVIFAMLTSLFCCLTDIIRPRHVFLLGAGRARVQEGRLLRVVDALSIGGANQYFALV